MTNHLGNMIFQRLRKRLIRPRPPSYPARQLLIPNQIMASQFLSIRLGQVGNDISLFEAEAVLGRLGSIPLHRVAGGELAEVIGVVKLAHVRVVCELGVFGGCSKVVETFGCGGGVKAGCVGALLC